MEQISRGESLYTPEMWETEQQARAEADNAVARQEGRLADLAGRAKKTATDLFSAIIASIAYVTILYFIGNGFSHDGWMNNFIGFIIMTIAPFEAIISLYKHGFRPAKLIPTGCLGIVIVAIYYLSIFFLPFILILIWAEVAKFISTLVPYLTANQISLIVIFVPLIQLLYLAFLLIAMAASKKRLMRLREEAAMIIIPVWRDEDGVAHPMREETQK